MPQYCQINTVYQLVFLLFKFCKLKTQPGRSTQGCKELVWECFSQDLSLKPILLVPSTPHQQHNGIKLSPSLSSSAINPLQSELSKLFRPFKWFFCSKWTWHAGQELVESNTSNKSGILLAKLIDGPTKTKQATAYSKLSKTHCITVTECLPLCAWCNMIVIAVKGRETNYMLNPAICRCFTQFHLLLPGQKFTLFSLVHNQSHKSLLCVIFDPLSKQFLYYAVTWLHWKNPHVLLRIHFLLVSLIIIIISIFSKRTVLTLFFPVNSLGAQP